MSKKAREQATEIREIGQKLKTLGEELRARQLDLKPAAELANIYGKELKAQQLELAERIFLKDTTKTLPNLGD